MLNTHTDRRFGDVVAVAIPRRGAPGTGKVFVEFSSTAASEAASTSLDGRSFGGRRVSVDYFSEAKMAARDYS